MEKRKLEQKKLILPKDYQCKLCTGIGTNFGNNEFKCYGFESLFIYFNFYFNFNFNFIFYFISLVEDIRINTLHTIIPHEKKKQSILLGLYFLIYSIIF